MSGRWLRISFFTSYVHEQGTYFRSHNLALGLNQLGHEVTVFGCDLDSKAAARKEDRGGVRYVIVPESWKPSVFSQFNHPGTAIRRWFGRYPACHVTHLFQPFLGGAAAWSRCHAAARFYDWDDQWSGGLMAGPIRSWRERWPRLATSFLEKRLPRYASHVTVVGDYLGRLARERGASNITTVHNGYWPGSFPTQRDARAELGLRRDALYVGFMGRTTQELEWCAAGVAATLHVPNLRLAICGPRPDEVARLGLGDRVDYLGELPAAKTRTFAAALDLGLLPLANTAFNQSRFPIKFCEHLATGRPLLCSEVGEVGRLAREYSGAIPTAATREGWIQDFVAVVERCVKGDIPRQDQAEFARRMSWAGLSRQLEAAYLAALPPRVGSRQ